MSADPTPRPLAGGTVQNRLISDPLSWEFDTMSMPKASSPDVARRTVAPAVAAAGSSISRA